MISNTAAHPKRGVCHTNHASKQGVIGKDLHWFHLRQILFLGFSPSEVSVLFEPKSGSERVFFHIFQRGAKSTLASHKCKNSVQKSHVSTLWVYWPFADQRGIYTLRLLCPFFCCHSYDIPVCTHLQKKTIADAAFIPCPDCTLELSRSAKNRISLIGSVSVCVCVCARARAR